MYYLVSEFNPYLGSLIRTMKTLSGLMPRQICVSEMQSFSGTEHSMFSLLVFVKEKYGRIIYSILL